MGKHSGPAPTPSGRSHERTAARGPVPAVLAQTVVLGGVAILIAVVALVWTGVDAKVAAACGVGLLVVGAVAVLLLLRTGLLHEPRPAPGARPGTDPDHP